MALILRIVYTYRYSHSGVERGCVCSSEVGVAGLCQWSDKIHCFAILQHHTRYHKVGKMQLWLQRVVVAILLSCVVESPLRIQAQSEYDFIV